MMLERGKHHPQIILSMASEYALVMFILDWFGVPITGTIVAVTTVALLLVILVVGYLDIYLDVARKDASFHARFAPEQQELYRQVTDLERKMNWLCIEIQKRKRND